jgi:hypothetical protein
VDVVPPSDAQIGGITVGAAQSIVIFSSLMSRKIFAPFANEAKSTLCGGNGLTVFYGMAKPVAAPQIGPARAFGER